MVFKLLVVLFSLSNVYAMQDDGQEDVQDLLAQANVYLQRGHQFHKSMPIIMKKTLLRLKVVCVKKHKRITISLMKNY